MIIGLVSLDGPNSAADSVRIPPVLGPQLISTVCDDFNSVSFLSCLNIDVAQYCMAKIVIHFIFRLGPRIKHISISSGLGLGLGIYTYLYL